MIFVVLDLSQRPLSSPSIIYPIGLMDSHPHAWVQSSDLGFQAHNALLWCSNLQTFNPRAWSTSQAIKNQDNMIQFITLA